MSAESEVFLILKNHRKPKVVKRLCFRKWTTQQNDIFARKLEQYLQVMKSRQLRKKTRIFRQISLSIPTKNCKQVKSHHQKLMLRHQSLEQIISCYKIQNPSLVKVQHLDDGISESEGVKQEDDSSGPNESVVKQQMVEMGDMRCSGIKKEQQQLQPLIYYYYY